LVAFCVRREAMWKTAETQHANVRSSLEESFLLPTRKSTNKRFVGFKFQVPQPSWEKRGYV